MLNNNGIGKHDAVLIALYIIVLAIIIITLSDVFFLGITLVIILIITFIQKIFIENEFTTHKEERQRFVLLFSDKIDGIAKTMENIGTEFRKSTYVMDSRITEVRHEFQTESEKQYRDLARKILDNENKVNEIKKNLAVAYSSLDERIQNIKKQDEI